LNNVILPLTGNNCFCSAERRKIYTVAVWECTPEVRLRLMFLQPELATATANTGIENSTILSVSRARVLKWPNLPDSGSLTRSESKCQMQGRITPYAVDEAGLTGKVSWGHCNIAKSRLIFLFTSVEYRELFTLSSRSLEILRNFVPAYCR